MQDAGGGGVHPTPQRLQPGTDNELQSQLRPSALFHSARPEQIQRD